MAKNLLFSFEEITQKDKPIKELTRYFKRAGIDVVEVDIDSTIKRTSGVPYREIVIAFTDSQKVTLRIKQTGDVFQVLLNGKLFPLKAQDDHVAAVAELAKAMDRGRAAFQKKLAMVKTKLPPSIRTAAPQMLATLTKRRDDLKVAIEAVRDQIKEYQAKLA